LARRTAQALSALLVSAAASAQAPVADLVYDEAADAACAQERGTPIDPAWQAELRAQLPRLQALWHAQAPAMFEAATRLVGRPLLPSPRPVRLTLCGVPSQSFGGQPLVSMRYALKSFTPEPVPLRIKIDTAFHESLHLALATLPAGDSALLRRHEGEPPCVRQHLHLLALQKAVLLALDQPRALEALMAADAQLPSGCYRRAWAIVGPGPEAHLPFVHELAARR
jgi:hypothetical protein